MSRYGCMTVIGLGLAEWVGSIWIILKLVTMARHPNEEDNT